MNSLILAAQQNRVFANLLAALLILLGFFALQTITVKLFPTIDLETISITVPYPGASPAEVEAAVIKPIEEKLEGLEGIRKITSVASENIGSILVALEAGENQNVKLNDIQNEVDQITVLPSGAERPVIALAEPDELAAQFIFHGEASMKTLKQQAQIMRDLLIDQPGISDVRIESVPEYLIDIQVRQQDLEAYNLSLQEVASAIRQSSLDLSGGDIEGQERRLLVRTLGERRQGYQFGDIPLLTTESGAIITLKDVADINDDLEDSPVAGFYNGVPAVVLGVYRNGAEQIFDLVNKSDEVLAREVKPALPDGVDAFMWRNESVDLQSRIDLLKSNAIIGLILVCVLLLLFIDVRVALWVAFGVTVSFVGSFPLLAWFGYTINQLSLFGFILAIGIVVDDAIVVGENIYAKREQGLGPNEAAIQGSTEVSFSVLTATLTTITVFVPLLFIPGIYGQFMGPIAAVVIFVLLISLIESFFILPRHLSHLSDRAPRYFSPRRILDPARQWTSAKLQWFIQNPVAAGVNVSCRFPLLTVLFFIGAFALSLLLITSGAVKFVFFPEIEGDYVTATLELPNETSQDETLQAIQRLEKNARAAASEFQPATKGMNSIIVGVFSTRGQNVGGGDPNASANTGAAGNLAYVTVKIEDAAQRQFTAVEFERAWRERTGEIPGAKKLLFSSNLVSAGSPVQLEIKSRDEAQAKQVAAKLRDALTSIDGVIDIEDDRFNTSEEIQLTLKPEAALYGVNTTLIAESVRAAYFGAVATRLPRDREEVDVRVRLSSAERQSVESLYQLKIKVGDVFVPLSALAEIQVGDAPAQISRKDGRRVITLAADVDTRITTGNLVTETLLSKHWQPLAEEFSQVEVTLGGDQEEQSRAGPAIARNFFISMFVIYALLALSFQSYAQPLIIMSIIPFGFMGAVLGHFMTGFDLTLLSMFGVIGLSGVIINDSLLLMQFVNQKLKEMPIVEAVKQATLQRFRPIIVTSLTTSFGVLPIIFERSIQAQFLAPTAVSLGIGILFGTVVLIFLLPALTVLQAKLKQRINAV